MSRPVGSKNRLTFDFAVRFDQLCKTHIDPLVLLFKVASAKDKTVGDWGRDNRMEASKTLLSYRYPKLKSIEVSDNTERQLVIGWLEQEGLENGGTGDRADSDTLPTALPSENTTRQ